MNVYLTVNLEEDGEKIGTATISLTDVVTQPDGYRHGFYLLHVNLEKHRVFGQYLVARIRLATTGGLALRVTDNLPPRAGAEYFWDPDRGWWEMPIGPLDWVEDRVLLWAFGLDEILDDVVIGHDPD